MTVMHNQAEITKPKQAPCHYCGKVAGRKNKQCLLTWDHVIPTARGGANVRANLVLACYDCNMDKGALHLSEFRQLRTLQYMSTRVLGVRILKMKFAGERTAYVGRPAS